MDILVPTTGRFPLIPVLLFTITFCPGERDHKVSTRMNKEGESPQRENSNKKWTEVLTSIFYLKLFPQLQF